MLERIIIAKTFISSKLWFLGNFIYIDKFVTKSLNSIIYKFVWNNNKETIKRDSLILTYEKGGLNMFHIESRLKTINIQNFLYIIKNRNRPFFCMSIYWLKFCLREFLLNFNIIPSGEDCERPAAYQKMIMDINDLKKINKDFINDKSLNISKNIYLSFKKKFEKTPKCESLERQNFSIIWKEVYSKTLNKQLNSELRVFNYKVLMDGVKLVNKNQNEKCSLCKKANESNEHLFVFCRKYIYFFNLIKYMFKKQTVTVKKELILYHEDLEEFIDFRLISVFKKTIWFFRNHIKYQNIKISDDYFISLFRKNLRIYN